MASTLLLIWLNNNYAELGRHDLTIAGVQTLQKLLAKNITMQPVENEYKSPVNSVLKILNTNYNEMYDV